MQIDKIEHMALCAICIVKMGAMPWNKNTPWYAMVSIAQHHLANAQRHHYGA